MASALYVARDMTESFAPQPYTPPPADNLQTLHVDDHVIVASKPSGLLSVPGRGPEKAFSAASILTERHGPALTVHRLDMDTSGIMVFARSKTAQSRLSRAFQERKVEKAYLAIVHGQPNPASGDIDLPIAAYSKQRPLRHIEEGGQHARTLYRTLETSNQNSFLELHPITGRSHQLRLHLQAIGHPILGDRFYGQPDGVPELRLHASNLSFPHPDTGMITEFFAPKPDYFQL